MIIGAIAVATASIVHAAETSGTTVVSIDQKEGLAHEQRDRAVDQAAIAAQKEAQKMIEQLLKKYRGSEQEPVLLTKLADVLQQTAAIQFRVAHGKSAKGERSLDLGTYKETMGRSITVLNQLVAKYPRYMEIDLAYFMRGKAYEEIGKKKEAKKDYLTLIDKFPIADHSISAMMSLAEFAIEDNFHEEALSYLKRIEKFPDSPQYPFALFKAAWSYYNLRNITDGVTYLEKHLNYYNERAKKPTGLSHSESAIRENTLLDLALFFFDGYELKLHRFTMNDAYPYFKKIDSASLFGRMSQRFAKLLRAHEHEADLKAWKDILVANEISRPETLEVALIHFEDQVNKRRYFNLGDSARDFVRIYQSGPEIAKSEAYQKLQKTLTDTTENLQKLTIKNKKANEVKGLTTNLAALYDTFTKVVPETDPRIPKARYNLAETLFEIQDFDGATEHYRWVILNSKSKKTEEYENSLIRAIASRYEVLKKTGGIPSELKAAAELSDSDAALSPTFTEWLGWIDDYADRHDQTSETFEAFRFDAHRTLYSHRKYKDALKRLVDFSEDHPTSKFAIPSASLSLDSYVTSKNWSKAHELATKLLKVKGWKEVAFTERVFQIAADSFYKLVEMAQADKDVSKWLSLSKECLKLYSKSNRHADCLLQASKASIADADEEEAEEYLGQLVAVHPTSNSAAPGLVERAAIFEKNFRFRDAADDYKAYLSHADVAKNLSNERSLELRERVLLLYWLGGQAGLIRNYLSKDGTCTKDFEKSCDQYRALAHLASRDSFTPDEVKSFFERAHKGFKDNQAVWATLALNHSHHLALRDQLTLFTLVTQNYSSLKPMIQFAVLPILHGAIPAALSRARADLPKYSKLEPTPKSIKKRIEWMKDIEAAATQVAQLPWTRLQTLALAETSALYSEFTDAIRAIPEPAGMSTEEKDVYSQTIQQLVFPFEEKAQDIRRKAFELASKQAVHEAVFAPLAQAFFKDNPSQAKSIQYAPEMKVSIAADSELLARWDDAGDWKKFQRPMPRDFRVEAGYEAKAIRWAWSQAVEKNNYAALAFFIRKAEAQKDFSKISLALMKSFSLMALGAQSEALAEIEASLPQFNPELQPRIKAYLLSKYYDSYSKERMKDWTHRFTAVDAAQLDSNEAFVILYGATWAGVKLDDQIRMSLLSEAKSVRSDAQRSWARAELAQLEANAEAQRKLASEKSK